MHARKANRHAIRNILLGNPQAAPGNPVYPLTGIGAKVHTNRPTPRFKPELPSACIYSPEEESDDRKTNPPTLFRDCDHIIEVLFAAGDDIDDKGDDYAEAIENLLGGNQFLKDPVTGLDTCSRHVLVRTELGLVADEVNSIYASLKLGWRVEYETQHAFPAPANAGDFDTLHTQMELGGTNETPESEDHSTGIHQGD